MSTLLPGMYTVFAVGKGCKTNLAFIEAHTLVQRWFESGAEKVEMRRQPLDG